MHLLALWTVLTSVAVSGRPAWSPLSVLEALLGGKRRDITKDALFASFIAGKRGGEFGSRAHCYLLALQLKETASLPSPVTLRALDSCADTEKRLIASQMSALEIGHSDVPKIIAETLRSNAAFLNSIASSTQNLYTLAYVRLQIQNLRHLQSHCEKDILDLAESARPVELYHSLLDLSEKDANVLHVLGALQMDMDNNTLLRAAAACLINHDLGEELKEEYASAERKGIIIFH